MKTKEFKEIKALLTSLFWILFFQSTLLAVYTIKFWIQ